MHLSMYGRTYVRMYVCTSVRTYVVTYVRTYVGTFANIHMWVRLLGRGAFGKAYLVESLKPPCQGTSGSQQRVLKKLPLTGLPESQREAAFREVPRVRL